jgi:hypothetical protein
MITVFAMFLAAAHLALAPAPLPIQGQNFPPAHIAKEGNSQISMLLSKEEVKLFLRTAEVIRSEQIGKGLTHPWRLTLSDGNLTHDASFQDVDIRTQEAGFAGGGRELNFADSYHFNIAAYELAVLLEVDDMVPITVEREWQGKKGSLSWWVDDVKMDEDERQKSKLTPQDASSWNGQMHKVRVFSKLIYDTDRNLQNILITGDWRIWIIDFSRAFRTVRKIPEPEDLLRCERNLFSKLEGLSKEALTQAAGAHLTKWEIDALLARRDLMVAHLKKLIAEKGETKVLY